MSNIWGPSGDFLGNIGDGPSFPILPLGDGGGCGGCISGIMMVFVVIPLMVMFGIHGCQGMQSAASTGIVPQQIPSYPSQSINVKGSVPGWISNLEAKSPNDVIEITPKNAIEFTTVFFRKAAPQWRCISTVQNLEKEEWTKDGYNYTSYKVKFKLIKPKGAAEKKMVSEFTMFSLATVGNLEDLLANPEKHLNK